MTKIDLQNLLDQIQRLDQDAIKGPWTTGENVETGLKYFGTGYCDCCTPPIPSAGVILGETGRAEAEFIALARTALPKLAAEYFRSEKECWEVGEYNHTFEPVWSRVDDSDYEKIHRIMKTLKRFAKHPDVFAGKSDPWAVGQRW